MTISMKQTFMPRSFLVGLLVAIVLLAVNMRSPIIGFGALAPLIQADLQLSTQMIGVIGTIPMVAFAMSSFVAPKVSQRIGLENTLILACGLLILGIFGRVWQASLGYLLVGTVLLSVAISLANVLIPAVIKKYAFFRLGLVMGLYSLTLSVMAGVSAGVAMRLVAVKDWQFALGIWGVVSVVALLVWVWVRLQSQMLACADVSEDHDDTAMAVRPMGVWRLPLAWWISGLIGIQSLLYYTLAAFLPSLLVDKGLSEQQAGLMGMIFQFMAFPSIILLSKWVTWGYRLQGLAMVAALGSLLGVIGFGFLSLAWAWLWAMLTGFGCGVIFTLCLMLFTLKTKDSVQASELSGMAQSVGYGIAILGPLLTGWLKDLSQGWEVPMVFLTVLMVIKCVCAWFATQDRPLVAR